jgi:hypothetical protein
MKWVKQTNQDKKIKKTLIKLHATQETKSNTDAQAFIITPSQILPIIIILD